jgi:hypothetical protein
MNLDQCEEVTPTIIRGEYKVLNVQLQDISKNTFFNLTGATEIDCVFLKDDQTYLTKKLTLSGVVIIDAPSGKIQIILLEADTLSLLITPEGELSGLEVRVTIASKKFYAQLKNTFKVVASMFP